MGRLVRRSLVVAGAFLAGVAAQGQTPVRQTLAVPDLPGFRTLKADFHLHTVFSDGNAVLNWTSCTRNPRNGGNPR